jgi:hypothetical protein
VAFCPVPTPWDWRQLPSSASVPRALWATGGRAHVRDQDPPRRTLIAKRADVSFAMNDAQRFDRPGQLGIPLLAQPQSLNDCRVDHVAKENAVLGALARRLHHVNDDHLLLRIDPEIGAAGAAPEVVAKRACNRRHPSLDTHAEAEAELVAGSSPMWSDAM